MTVCTFDASPPARPTEADVGGCAKQDDAEFPPNPVTDATSDDYNQIAKLAQRLAGLVPVCSVHVEFNAGTPAVIAVACLKSGITTSSFTLDDMGDGVTRVRWTAGTFPSRTLPSRATLVGSTLGLVSVEPSTFYAIVRTGTATATPADIDFVLDIYGE